MSETASNYWHRLSPRTQLQIVLSLARRRQVAFRRKYRNVVNVGAGLRLTGCEPEVHREYCLSFLVQHKWPDKRQRRGKIPAFVTAYWRTRSGQRRRLLIPTDVSEFRGIPHAQQLDLTNGILSLDGVRRVEYGSACCLVHDSSDPSRHYILGCYHVIVPNMIFPPPSMNLRATAMDGNTIGPLFQGADPVGRVPADAALIEVDNPAIDRLSLWGHRPVRYATEDEFEGMLDGRAYYLYPRRLVPPNVSGANRGSELRVTPVSVHPPSDYDYQQVAGRWLTFPVTVRYIGDVRPGDSGAPLMDEDYALYGMHFFGDNTFGYAQAAWVLFEQVSFDVDIEL